MSVAMNLDAETFDKLRQVSTATLCTQLFKRGLRNVYVQGVARMTVPSTGNLVGPAYTVRNIPAREDLDQISVFENPEHDFPKRIIYRKSADGSLLASIDGGPGTKTLVFPLRPMSK